MEGVKGGLPAATIACPQRALLLEPFMIVLEITVAGPGREEVCVKTFCPTLLVRR